ncbi:MAG: elongation factor P [Acidobacteria bacterium]|nr:elongation factor P [Acidobacteriota bacterium]MBI3424982.1 elongation factor P [Acidobacteriota bacterium]
MASIKANQIRKGMVLLHNGVPHRVIEFHHHTPGNLRAMVQTRMRNLKTGNTMEHRFSSTESVERAHFEEQEMSYLYSEAETYYFMNNDSYEQIGLHEEELGDDVGYLLPETNVKVEFFEGQPISVTIPGVVELKVVETEPEIKGATVSNVGKPAKLETGITIQVPAFIKEGEKIRVDTTEGRYIERAR